MPFVKLDCSILDSSLWNTTSAEVKVVWITMLALAGADGFVNATIPGIAHRACVSPLVAQKAIDIFLGPDKFSRCTDADGRRISKIEGGYLVLNYTRYRSQGRVDTGIGVGGNPTTYEKPGKVYFIRCGDRVKIGFSQNPWARLNSLKTGSPTPPTLMGYMNGTMALEAELHRRFEPFSTHGEWYELTPQLQTYIDSATSGSLGSLFEGATGSYESPEAEAEVRNIKSRFARPTIEDLRAYCKERQNRVDPQKWLDYYSSNGWKVGRNPMKDWKASIRLWERNEFSNGNGQKPAEPGYESQSKIRARELAERKAQGL